MTKQWYRIITTRQHVGAGANYDGQPIYVKVKDVDGARKKLSHIGGFNKRARSICPVRDDEVSKLEEEILNSKTPMRIAIRTWYISENYYETI